MKWFPLMSVVLLAFSSCLVMAADPVEPTEPVERDGLVVSWQSKSGKWYAHGPVQKTSSSWETEEKALSYAAGVGSKKKGVLTQAKFIKKITLAKRGKEVKLYRLNYKVKDKNKGPTWGRDIRYSYPELKDVE